MSNCFRPAMLEARPRCEAQERGAVLAMSIPGTARPAAPMTRKAGRSLVVFLPPALLLFTVFVAMPMGEAGWYSFYNWNGYGRPENFIGLKNYGYLFGNARSRAR